MQNIKQKIKFLTAGEVQEIIDSIKVKKGRLRGARDRALFEILFSTGLRISECLDLPDAVFAKESEAETMELSITGKGGYQRTIYVSPSAVRAVRAYMKVRRDIGIKLFPLGVRQAQNIVKQRSEKVGFEGVHPHTLRHSFAVNLLKNNVNIYYVQQFLGHRALSSTSQYLHTSNAELKGLHSKLYK